MPHAATHILIPMILVDFIRDHFFKTHRRKWPNKYIFLVGVAGLLPDIDIPISLILNSDISLHRTFTHTVWFPLFFLFLFLISYYFFRKVKMFNFKLWKACLMLFIGTFLHVFLDAILAGTVNLFYPLIDNQIGLNFIPAHWTWFYSSLDALLLFGWLIHEEIEHNISDYF